MPLKFDVTKDNDANTERKLRYDALTLPSVVFMSADGKVLGRVRKMMEPDDFLKILGPRDSRSCTQMNRMFARSTSSSSA